MRDSRAYFLLPFNCRCFERKFFEVVIHWINHVGGFCISFCIAAFLSIYAKKLGFFIVERQDGPQKIHQVAVPRVGGGAILAGVLVQMIYGVPHGYILPWLLTGATIPVFLAGIVEDITGKVSAKVRLNASLLTGFCFIWFTGYSITKVGVEFVDLILSMSVFSIFVTAIAIASLANAMNMIDGLNGLMGVVALFICLAIFAVAYQLNGSVIVFSAVSLAVAVFGFLLWNFPFGRIFAGDGGAYYVGASIAGIVIVVPQYHPEISAFFSLLLVSYPFYELLRSTARRLFVPGLGVFSPDDQHLHSLVFKVIQERTVLPRFAQNSLASSIVLTLPLVSSFWSVFCYDDSKRLIFGIITIVVCYEIVIVIFKQLRQVCYK